MLPNFVKKQLGEGKALPKPVRFIIDAEFQRKFTWGERWRILWGYTAIISYRGLARCHLITAANAIADGRHVDAYMEAQSALVDIAQGKNAADAKRQNVKLTNPAAE